MAEHVRQGRARPVLRQARAALAAGTLALLLAGCQPGGAAPGNPAPPPSAGPSAIAPPAGDPGLGGDEGGADAALTPARVLDVVDGDTIRVAIDGRSTTVRYIGIDTPETVRPNHPVEWMGPEATAANKALVAGQTVYLEKDVSETDSYGRLLRYVYLAGTCDGTPCRRGTMVNAELVRLGYAHAGTYPPDVKHQDLLQRAEREARQAGRGLWGPRGTPSATPRPAPAGSSGAGPLIAAIHANGAIEPDEPDEYCDIRNDGPEAVQLAGWRLNAGREGQDLILPAYRLRPGQVCRVYTGPLALLPHLAEGQSAAGGGCVLSFGSDDALWRNGGDCGRLYDPGGTLMSEICYGDREGSSRP